MRNALLTGMVFILLMSGCKKIAPAFQVNEISFPFKNAHISMDVASVSIPEKIRDIHFFNESVGIAMSYDGKVYKTTDKGISWNLKYTNTISEQSYHQIFFKDQYTGYIVGGNSGCSGTGCTPPGGILIKTIDGGETWSVIHQVPGAVDFTSIALNANGDLYVLQDGSKTKILKSTDEGLSWTINATINAEVNKIAFKDHYGFLIGGVGNATVIRSSDNGLTWNDTKTFNGNWVGDISFSDNIAYCIVDGITLYKSVDYGDTWHVSYQNQHYFSYVINALTDKSCIIWGAGEYTGGCFGYTYGAFRQSTDSGNSWTETQLKEIGNIRTSSFYSPTEGYILSGKLIWVKTNIE